MKNRSSQTNGVENGSNTSQSVPNIKINDQKQAFDLYKGHKGHLEKISLPHLKTFPIMNGYLLYAFVNRSE